MMGKDRKPSVDYLYHDSDDQSEDIGSVDSSDDSWEDDESDDNDVEFLRNEISDNVLVSSSGSASQLSDQDNLPTTANGDHCQPSNFLLFPNLPCEIQRLILEEILVSNDAIIDLNFLESDIETAILATNSYLRIEGLKVLVSMNELHFSSSNVLVHRVTTCKSQRALLEWLCNRSANLHRLTSLAPAGHPACKVLALHLSRHKHLKPLAGKPTDPTCKPAANGASWPSIAFSRPKKVQACLAHLATFTGRKVVSQ